jgi:hypothetical protein
VTDDVPDFTEEQLRCPLDTFSLEAITGVVFLDPDPIVDTPDGVACSFRSEDGDLEISVATGARAAGTDDATAVDVDFADEASWSSATTTLRVVKGGAVVQIKITDPTGRLTDHLQVAKELAEFAL